MFDYLLAFDRDVAVSAIYHALLCLFEAKGRSHVRLRADESLMMNGESQKESEVEYLSNRIINDITTAEGRELAAIPEDVIRNYTTALARVARSRYTATQDVRSRAIRFLREIDPANSEHGLAVH